MGGLRPPETASPPSTKWSPAAYRAPLACRHDKIACIPLMAYAIPMEEIVDHAEQGYFFMKVKIGSDPDHDGDREKMLQWDMARVEAIHKAIGHIETPYTENGRIPYYFDANGRYDSKERLQRLLDHCRKIGALDQIAIIEEPFPEEYKVPVGDLGVRIAADESAHCDHDVAERIELGYGAIALKPIAKTLSMTLKIADVAFKAGVPMFCADLTVGPAAGGLEQDLRQPACPAARREGGRGRDQRTPELPPLGGTAILPSLRGKPLDERAGRMLRSGRGLLRA